MGASLVAAELRLFNRLACAQAEASLNELRQATAVKWASASDLNEAEIKPHQENYQAFTNTALASLYSLHDQRVRIAGILRRIADLES